MSACPIIAFPSAAGRSYTAVVVEPLYDQSANGSVGALSDFDLDFDLDFGALLVTVDALFNAILRDMRGFPLFDETPETGQTATITGVDTPAPCTTPAFREPPNPYGPPYLWDYVPGNFDDIPRDIDQF